MPTSSLSGCVSPLGDGRFERASTVYASTGLALSGILAGDVDGDGMTDLVVREITFGDPSIRVLNGDGLGSFAPPVMVVSINQTTFNGGQLGLRDLDGDGDLDLTFPVGPAPALVGAINDGAGAFGAPYLLHPGSPRPGVPLFNDMNGDGAVDLVMAATNRVDVALGNGDGTFAQPILGLPLSFTPFPLGLGDVTGNGQVDVIIASAETSLGGTDAILVLEGAGNGTLSAPLPALSGLGRIRDLSLSDIDLDGRLDLLVCASGSTALGFAAGLGQGAFAAPIEVPLGEDSIGSFPQLVVAEDLDLDGDPDALVVTDRVESGVGLWRQLEAFDNATLGGVGTEYCTAAANSTGVAGQIEATGSTEVSLNRVELAATELPTGSVGMFLVSRSQAMVSGIPGSVGTLCLGGAIGRYVGPGQLQNSGTAGRFELAIDLGALPDPSTGQVVAQPGETWFFQAWHRDTLPAGGATSNFTTGLQVVLR